MPQIHSYKQLNFMLVLGTCVLVVYFEIIRTKCVIVSPAYYRELTRYELRQELSTLNRNMTYRPQGYSGKFNWTERDLGTNNHNGSGAPKYTFKPVNATGIQIFQDLCLEYKDDCESSCPCPKKFVVYNANVSDEVTLPVRIAPKWVVKSHEVVEIEYRTEKIPSTHRVNNRMPTYFVVHSMDGNLHHFFNDCFIGLYGIMKATGRLHHPDGNQVLYRENERGCQAQKRAHDITRYESFTLSLSVERKHDWFENVPANTCFSTAVFGYYPEYESPDEPFDYIKDHVLDDARRTPCPEMRVTIIQRTRRKILNMDQVVEATVQAGFEHVDVHIFEYLSLQEQLAVIACTNVLVGVQGAGLEWFNFAKPDRALVEFTWHNWPPFYTPMFSDRAVSVNNPLFAINWHSFHEAEMSKKRELTDKDKERFLRRNVTRKLNTKNVWKWADVIIDTRAYSSALKKTKDILAL